MNNYFLRANGAEVLICQSNKVAKSTHEVFELILSVNEDKAVKKILDLPDIPEAINYLKINLKWSFSEPMYYYPLMMAHAEMVRRNTKGDVSTLPSDFFPTSYYLKNPIGEVHHIGSFYCTSIQDVDDMLPLFCELSDHSYAKKNKCPLKFSLSELVRGGYTLYANEGGNPTILLEIDSTGSAYGRESTIKFFGFQFFAAA